MKMKDNEIVGNCMTHVMIVVNQRKQYGDDIEDKRVIKKVFKSLPKKFELVLVPIEEYKDLSQMQLMS